MLGCYRGPQNWALILGLVTGLVALLVIVGVLCCCLCQRRRRRPIQVKSDAPNGDITHQEKSLLTVVNPVQKPPRRYDDRPTELAEVNRNLLEDTGKFDTCDELQQKSTSLLIYFIKVQFDFQALKMSL